MPSAKKRGSTRWELSNDCACAPGRDLVVRDGGRSTRISGNCNLFSSDEPMPPWRTPTESAVLG
jgi:hypothetical protein